MPAALNFSAPIRFQPASRVAASAFAATLLAACATTPPDDPQDPLEGLNRRIFAFNLKVDDYILRPLATNYKRYVPNPVQNGVRNFLDNLFYPTTIINGLLQGKFDQAGEDTGRFLLNTTVGILGIFDPATQEGLVRHQEDFGQTLGYWGVGTGWYLMLPFLGPSTNRDLVGRVGNIYTQPTAYVPDATYYVVGATGVGAVSARADALGSRRLLEEQSDPYLFLRTSYLQKRLNDVYDGDPPAAMMGYEPPDPETVDGKAAPAKNPANDTDGGAYPPPDAATLSGEPTGAKTPAADGSTSSPPAAPLQNAPLPVTPPRSPATVTSPKKNARR